MESNIEWNDTPANFRLIANEVRANHRLTGETEPVIYAIQGKELVCAPIPPFAMDNKWMVEEVMKKIAQSSNAVAMVSEAWVVEVKDYTEKELDEITEIAKDGNLHEHVHRVEAITIGYNCPVDGLSAIAKFDDKNVQDWVCLSHKQQDDTACEGRFVNIYDRL